MQTKHTICVDLPCYEANVAKPCMGQFKKTTTTEVRCYWNDNCRSITRYRSETSIMLPALLGLRPRQESTRLHSTQREHHRCLASLNPELSSASKRSSNFDDANLANINQWCEATRRVSRCRSHPEAGIFLGGGRGGGEGVLVEVVVG